MQQRSTQPNPFDPYAMSAPQSQLPQQPAPPFVQQQAQNLPPPFQQQAQYAPPQFSQMQYAPPQFSQQQLPPQFMQQQLPPQFSQQAHYQYAPPQFMQQQLPPQYSQNAAMPSPFQYSYNAFTPPVSPPRPTCPEIKLEKVPEEVEGAAVPEVGANGVWINMILDESGSMQPVASSTIENFNKYLNEQREAKIKPAPVDEAVLNAAVGSEAASIASSDPQKIPVSDACNVSLVKFDAPHLYSVYERVPIQEVPPLDHNSYRPNGGTNLFDAIGAVIMRADAHLKSQPDVQKRPGVLVVIITDGQENSSQFFNNAVIKRMITARQNAGWTFVFLGANIDAWGAAAQVGVPQSHAFNFSVHQQDAMTSALSDSTTRFRGQQQYKQTVIAQMPAFAQPAALTSWNQVQQQQSYFSESNRGLEYPTKNFGSH